MSSATNQNEIAELEEAIKKVREDRMSKEREMLATKDITNRTQFREKAEGFLQEEINLKKELDELKSKSSSVSITPPSGNTGEPAKDKQMITKVSNTDRQRLIDILDNIRKFREAPSDYLGQVGIPSNMRNGLNLNATSAGTAVLELQAWGEIHLDEGQTGHALTMLVNLMLNHVNVQDKTFLRGLLGEDQKKN